MKKSYKILAGLMFSLSAIAMIFTLRLSLAAPVVDTYGDFEILRNDDNSTVTFTKYTGSATEVTIPSTVKIGNVTYSVIVAGGTTTGALFAGNTNITKVTFANGVKAADNLNSLFYGCENLQEIVFNNFNTSETTSMSNMFRGCSRLNALDLSSFDTSHVTSMASMFQECSSLKSLDLSNFVTSSVTTMSYMFYNCSAMTTLNMSSFTSESMTNIHYMLYGTSALKKIHIGDFDFLYQDPENSKYAYNFGRGTWKRLEDNKNYAISDVVYNNISGTYEWQSNSIEEMFVDYNVTYQIGKITKIDEYSFSNNDIFAKSGNSIFAKNLHRASSSDYTVPGSVTLLFNDVVTDTTRNKYNLRATIDNIHIYDINKDIGVDTFSRRLINISSGSLSLSGYNFTEDFQTIVYSDSASKLDLTLEIVDDNGVAQNGSFVFAARDLDIPSTKDVTDGTATYAYSSELGWGIYSEGINLISGYDESTIKFYSHTFLNKSGKRIYGIHFDESSEFTEFSIKANANKFKFTWTGEECGTIILKDYQPLFVDIIKQNQNGVNLQGANLELYNSNNVLIDSWTSTTEAHKLFLSVGRYTLKETKAPTNYTKGSNVTFYVDADGKIVVDNKTVTSVILKDNGKSVRVVTKYIDETNNTELDRVVNDNQKYGDVFTGERRNFTGYELTRTPSNETITLTQDETVLIYYYAKVSAGVLEKHIDLTNDNRIIYNETHTGIVGDDYDISSKTFEGLELVTDQLPSNSKGKMTDELIEVTYYYKAKGKVIVKYIDKTTNEPIIPEDVINGYVNDDYNSDVKNIPQYVYVESKGNSTGKIGNDDGEIIYYYKRVVYVTTEVTENGGGNITGDETVDYHGDSTLDRIVIEADKDHYINKVTINGEEVKVTNDSKMVLANFTNMEENKHIIVEFQSLISNVPKTDMNTILPIIAVVLLGFGILIVYLGNKKKKLVLDYQDF